MNAGADDESVLALARADARVLLTEDKDFGLLAYAVVRETAGVILIRFPAGARSSLGQAVIDFVTTLGDRITGAFTVLEPGRARLSRPGIPKGSNVD